MAEIAADPTAARGPARAVQAGALEGRSTTGSPLAAERGEVRADARPRRTDRDARRRRLMRAAHPLGRRELDDDWVDTTTDLLMRGIAP